MKNGCDLKKQLLMKLQKVAGIAYADVYKNYWKVTEAYSCLANEFKEGRDTLSELAWNFVMMLLAMETYYHASGDEYVLHCVREQMNTYYQHSSEDFFLATGGGSNPAHDDAAWTAMGFMLAYRLTNDMKALGYAREMIIRSYDYWQDGTTKNGLWYCYPEDNNGHIQVKSIYCAGLILSALDYYEVTKGTRLEDAKMHQRTMDLYEWVEKNLRRDGERTWNGQVFDYCDNLYFCDFIDDKQSGAYHPRQYNETEHIVPKNSWTSLFGNMAMSVINEKLFKLTGDRKYREKALATANALVKTEFNRNGCFLNDRDAWTNTAFLGVFVREIFPLEEADPELGRMLLRTADAILKNTYYEGGFYGSDWDASGVWLRDDTCGEHTLWIPANATTVHVLFAAYAAMKNGWIEVTQQESTLMDVLIPQHKLDEMGNVVK